MYQYPSGPVYGGSNYNPATGAESRDLRPLSSDDPRYSQRLPMQQMSQPGMLGGMGGMSNRPTNKLPPGFQQRPQISEEFRPPGAPEYGLDPVIMDGDGGMRPPGYPPQTGGTTPLPFGDSGPVTFGPRGPSRVKNPPPTGDASWMGESISDPPGGKFIGYGPGVTEYDSNGMAGLGSDDFGQPSGDFWNRPPSQPMPMRDRRQGQLQQLARPRDDGYNQQRQQMNPYMGGNGFGGMGGYGQQQMQNPFMGGGGYGGFGGGFNQQMNPFMGGGGFGGYGGFGQQQMSPFMGGGFSQQQNPFMGGGGFGGGFGGMGGYGQQMQNPFMGGGGFGGYGQQMQQPMQRASGPMPQLPIQQPAQQPQQQQQPMGYQGGAF